MANGRIKAAWWGVAVCLLAGCTTTSKTPFANRTPEPASTAVSGSGEFASNEGAKNPAKIFLAYGQWAEQMGQLPEARDSYNKVLAEQPKNIDAILGLARVDQASGLMGDAEERLKKAEKLAAKDPRVLAACGTFLAAQGDWKKAVGKLEHAVKLAPDDARYQFLLAVTLARSGDVRRRVSAFRCAPSAKRRLSSTSDTSFTSRETGPAAPRNWSRRWP